MDKNSIHPTDKREAQLVDRLRALAGVTQPRPEFAARLEADLCARQRLISTEGMSSRTTHPINLPRQTTLKRLVFALAAVAVALALALGIPALFGDNRDLPPLPRLAHAADVGIPPEPAGLLAGADLTLTTDLPHAPAEVPVYRSTIALPPATPEEALPWARDFGLPNPQVYRDPREPEAIFVLGDDDRKLIFRPFGPMGDIHYGDDAAAAAVEGTPLPFDQAAECALAFLREHDLLPTAYRVEEPPDYEPSGERPIRMVHVVPELDGRPLVGYNAALQVAVNPAGQVTYASFNALHTERGGEYPIKSAQEAYDELTGREVAGSPFRLDTDTRYPAGTDVRHYYPDPPAHAADDPVTTTGWVHVLVAEPALRAAEGDGSDVRAQLMARDGTQYDLTGPRVAELASVGYDDVEVRGKIVAQVGPDHWQVEVIDWETAPQRQPQCLVGTFTSAGEEGWLATDEGERYCLPCPPDELADGERIEVCADEGPVEGEELDWWIIVSPPTPEQGYVGSSSSTVSVVVEEVVVEEVVVVSVVVEEAVEVPPDAPPPPPPPTPTPLARAHIVQEGGALEIGQSVEVTGVVHATVFVNEESRRVEASLSVKDTGERFPLSGPPDVLEAIAQLDRLHVRVHGQVVASPQEDWPSGTQTIEIESFEKIWPDERAQGFLGHLDLETLEGREVAVLTDHETGQRYVLASSLDADGGGWPLTGDPILNYKQVFVAGVVQPGETYAGLPVLRAAGMHTDSQTDAATSADEIPLDIPQVIDESRFPFGPQGRVEGTFFVDRVELAYYYEPQSPAPTVSPDEAPTWPQPAEQILQPVWVFYGHNADDTTRFVAYVQAITEEHVEDTVATVAPISPQPGTPTEVPTLAPPPGTSTPATPPSAYATQEAASQATIIARATASPFPTAGPAIVQTGQPTSATTQRDGLSFQIRLPKNTCLAGEAGRAEVTLRNDGPETVFVTGSGPHLFWPVLLDERGHEPVPWPWRPMIMPGGPPYLRELPPGQVVTETLTLQVPPMEQFAGHSYVLWAEAHFSRPHPDHLEGPDNLWLHLETGPVPLQVTPPNPADPTLWLIAELEADRDGWRLRVTNGTSQIPSGPLWGFQEVTSPNAASAGPLRDSADGTWARAWDAHMRQDESQICMRAWVAAPGYVTAAITQTVPRTGDACRMFGMWEPPARQTFASLEAAGATLDFPLFRPGALPDDTTLDSVQVETTADRDRRWTDVYQLYRLPGGDWLELTQMVTTARYESAGWSQARYAPEARLVSMGRTTGYVVQRFGWWVLEWKVGDVGFELRAPVEALSLEDLLATATGVQPLEETP